jgi:hypothetical protein
MSAFIGFSLKCFSYWRGPDDLQTTEVIPSPRIAGDCLAIVFELRKCLKRILGCPTEHHPFVDHLQ